MKKIISIDIETLALTPDAVVLSFGAACIDIINGVASIPHRVTYYEVLSYHDQLATRMVDQGTLDWWAKRDTEAMDVIAESKGRTAGSIQSDLVSFATWVLEVTKGNDRVYFLAKDPDFDGVILEHLFNEHNVPFPFKYNRRIALRTMAHAYEIATGLDAPYHKPEIKHNALSDAEAQAKDYAAMYNMLATIAQEA